MKTNNVPAPGWIRAMRDAAGLSSYELARRAGVSQPTVINWERRERGGTITLASLRRAAEALECDFAYAFTGGKAPVKTVPRKRTNRVKQPTPERTSTLVATRIVRSVDPNSIWE